MSLSTLTNPLNQQPLPLQNFLVQCLGEPCLEKPSHCCQMEVCCNPTPYFPHQGFTQRDFNSNSSQRFGTKLYIPRKQGKVMTPETGLGDNRPFIQTISVRPPSWITSWIPHTDGGTFIVVAQVISQVNDKFQVTLACFDMGARSSMLQ